jgi:hypothetical protein
MGSQANSRGGDLISITCRIDDVTGRIATVVDQFGNFRTVRTDIRRGSGPKPRAGETWIIDRSMGTWTFASRVTRTETPVIYGSTDENPALIALLSALDLLGLIENKTVNTQLRAKHPHTHPHTHPHLHTIPSWSTSPGGDPAHTHGIPEQDTEEDSTAQDPPDSPDTPDTDDDDPAPPYPGDPDYEG